MNNIEAEQLVGFARHLPLPVQSKIDRLIIEFAAAWAGLNHANQGADEAYRVWTQEEFAHGHRNQFTKTKGVDGRPVYQSRDDLWMTMSAPRLVARWDAWQRSKTNIPYLESRWQAYGFLFGLLDWLPENRRFKKYAPVKIKGTNHAEAVEKLREQIADIDDRYADTEMAACAADELVARAEIEVDRLANIGSIRVDPRVRDRSPVDLDWPDQAINRTSSIQPEKLIWLFRDEIKEKLAAQIRAETPAKTMTDFERAAELSALEADRLKLEREEEAHISAAADIGQFIARRRDANPLAILEIS